MEVGKITFTTTKSTVIFLVFIENKMTNWTRINLIHIPTSIEGSFREATKVTAMHTSKVLRVLQVNEVDRKKYDSII